MNNQTDIFGGYPQPKNYLQEVLLLLINKGQVSFFDFRYLQDFRKRISILKLDKGVNLTTKKFEGKTKYGNRYIYHIHYLSNEDKPQAIAIYNKMVKNE